MDYVLRVERVAAPCETEPNQPPSAPMSLGALSTFPVEVYGNTRAGASYQDYYEFTVPARPAGRHGARRARGGPRQQHAVAEHGRFRCRAHRTTRVTSSTGVRASEVVLLLQAERQQAVQISVGGEGRPREDRIPGRPGHAREDRDRAERHRVHLDPHGRHLAGSTGDDLGQRWLSRLGRVPDRARQRPAAGTARGRLAALGGAVGRGRPQRLDARPGGEPARRNSRAQRRAGSSEPHRPAAYYVRVVPVGTPATLRPEPYRLHVERSRRGGGHRAQRRSTSAQELPALPVRLRGMSRAFGVNPEDPDVFRFTLPRDLADGEELEIERAPSIPSMTAR